MPKGASQIPALRLSVLNGLIVRMDNPPSLFFANQFGTVQAVSDTMEWESTYGNAGLTPFVSPGGSAPVMSPLGTASNAAKAAYWKEKMYMDEEFLNNLRKPGTRQEYQTAAARIGVETQRLFNRCRRRREWMFAKMLVSGSFTYKTKGGNGFTVDYGLPAMNQVSITGTAKWNSSAPNILSDIFGVRQQVMDWSGVSLNSAVISSAMLKILVMDAATRTLLQKSAFGSGDLFARPHEVLASLFGLSSIKEYNEVYTVESQLMAAVPAGSAVTSIYVDDTADYELGAAYLHSMSTKLGNIIKQDIVITAIDPIGGILTITSVTPVLSFNLKDKVVQRKKYIPDNAFFMYSATGPDGMPIAEFMEAPFGTERNWGTYVDTDKEWDPDGIWLRVQDKGLPILYQPDCMATIWAY